MNLALAGALRLNAPSKIAFVGAGGKTTALFHLARELPAPVIVTATSHLGAWQASIADQHIRTDEGELPRDFVDRLKGITLVTGELEGDRTKPVHDDLLSQLKVYCEERAITLLIEADGSRGKPLKAWAVHEPPIPSFIDLVVQVAGLSALGKPLRDEAVHRAEVFSRLSGLPPGGSITATSLVHVLTHPDGGLKNMPPQARRIVLLNQADTYELQSAAQRLARSLFPAYQAVIVSSLQQQAVWAVHEPIAGIVLAAGASTRFGQPKQLLPWRGQPFVRAVANAALQAGLAPVVVVTGAHAEQVGSAVRDLDLLVAHNDNWQDGQAASIREGVGILLNGDQHQDVKAGGAIFLLADQPQVTGSILRALVEKHAQGLYPIVAPLIMDRRANPVLFDRITFEDLMTLEGDVGGRAIFSRHRLEYLPWHDERLLLDVDTPEMYDRLLSDEAP